nr:hypothetical protein [Microbacterium sp. XT11]
MLDEKPAVPKTNLDLADVRARDPKIFREVSLRAPSDPVLADVVEHREKHKRFRLGEPEISDALAEHPPGSDARHTSHTPFTLTELLIDDL